MFPDTREVKYFVSTKAWFLSRRAAENLVRSSHMYFCQPFSLRPKYRLNPSIYVITRDLLLPILILTDTQPLASIYWSNSSNVSNVGFNGRRKVGRLSFGDENRPIANNPIKSSKYQVPSATRCILLEILIFRAALAKIQAQFPIRAFRESVPLGYGIAPCTEPHSPMRYQSCCEGQGQTCA
jgi:hypothetical protein